MPSKLLPCCQEVGPNSSPVLHCITLSETIPVCPPITLCTGTVASIPTGCTASMRCAAPPVAGLAALGLYLYGPEAAFAYATSQLCAALEGIMPPSGVAADKLLFISSDTRKFLCKHRAGGTITFASLQVCEFKLAPSLSTLATLTCRYFTHPAPHSVIQHPCIHLTGYCMTQRPCMKAAVSWAW